MVDRRSALKTFAASAAALVAMRNARSFGLPDDDPYLSKIGLQLYTVRNQMANAPAQTLASIKAAGYDQVELMDVMDADVMVPLAKEQGLEATSAFMPWNILGQEKPENVATLAMVLDKATKNKLQHLVFGYIGKGSRETADQFKAMADRCNAAAETCAAANIQLCYHNHSFDFQPLDGGQCGFEIFIERFDPMMMKFELDVFWAAIGGWDPVETLYKLDRRVSQVHLKDLKSGEGTIYDEAKIPVDAFKEVGSGIIDMPAVIQAARKIGVVQCHVEQDQSPAPLKSVEQSVAYLKKMSV